MLSSIDLMIDVLHDVLTLKSLYGTHFNNFTRGFFFFKHMIT